MRPCRDCWTGAPRITAADIDHALLAGSWKYPGTPCLAISAIPPTPPASLTAPGTGCCPATLSRCTGAPPFPGDAGTRRQLVVLLARRGDLDALRGRANAGDAAAAWQLAGLLADRGDLDALRGRVDAGDRDAAARLAGLLARQGRGEEAERLRRFGLRTRSGSIGRT